MYVHLAWMLLLFAQTSAFVCSGYCFCLLRLLLLFVLDEALICGSEVFIFQIAAFTGHTA